MRWFFTNIVLATVLLLFIGCKEKSSDYSRTHQTIEGIVERIDVSGGGFLSPPITTVRFKDGRVKTFCDVSKWTFQEGKINIITFDPRDLRIKSVEIK